MAAQYVLRADDACPTMSSEKWLRFERLCQSNGIKPLIAVVPDNQDDHLKRSDPDDGFWARVRHWQSMGWSIGLHGFSHDLKTIGWRHLVPVNNYGEFPGLSYDEQFSRLSAAFRIFNDHQIDPEFFIAPAHAFNQDTCTALKALKPTIKISDGFAFDGFHEQGLFWLPQQLWRFQDITAGVWTICLHPSDMSDDDFTEVERWLQTNAARFVSAGDVPLPQRKRTPGERLFGGWFFLRRRIWSVKQNLGL